MISFKGRHHQQDMILQCVRWHVAYGLSYRDLEELMQERGYAVDHSTIQRWVVHYAPRIEKAFRSNKKRTGVRWRLDETYVKIKGVWKYFYRAVDKHGDTVDFLLTAKRDTKAVRRFLTKAIGAVEAQLQGQFHVPTVFLYPGVRTGKTKLKFLGFYPEDGNYRSVHVGG